MSLLLRNHINLAVTSLRRNRARTFLTALGIAIGVTAIVLILSFTGNIQRVVDSRLGQQSSSLIVIRPSEPSSIQDAGHLLENLTTDSKYSKSTLTLKDVDAIKNIQDVTKVAPLSSTKTSLEVFGKASPLINVTATSKDLKDIVNLPVKTGQFFDNKHEANSAVIGHAAAINLFGTDNAVAKTFVYNGKRFIVVGVLEERDDYINFNNINFNTSVLLNIDYTKSFDSPQIRQINVKVTSSNAVASARQNIENKLSEIHKGNQTFSILAGKDINSSVGSFFSLISALLAAVATISLVVGGVGVMNIMLVSVSERTREIGIRKAVGATSFNILLQFLFESLILCLFGGIIGFISAYLILYIISLFSNFIPYLSLEIGLITLATTLCLGLIFGIYPAIKAAGKDPISSIKYYR